MCMQVLKSCAHQLSFMPRQSSSPPKLECHNTISAGARLLLQLENRHGYKCLLKAQSYYLSNNVRLTTVVNARW